ncbi:MAG: hypothetical protein ABIE42_08510 [Candidatus Eisenbacteria bacterium]
MTSRMELDLKRHRNELSESDTDEVIKILADFIVTYLEKKSGCPSPRPGIHKALRPDGRR